MQAMGASVAQLPGPEILPAMEKGVIDAFEFNNPTSDSRFGAQDVAKYYYLGSYHQASEAIEVVYNKTKWDSLAKEQQQILKLAGMASNSDNIWKAWDIYSKDLETLITKHGVHVKRTPESIFKAQLAAWDKVVKEISSDANQGPIIKKILASQKAWGKRVGFYDINNDADLQVRLRALLRQDEGLIEPRRIRRGGRAAPASLRFGTNLRESSVENILLFIDRLSAGVGKAFGWCIVIMTLGTCYEVFVRYVLSAPTNWAFDVSYFMYGALFMMAGAYTLSRNGHVRGDVIYRLMPVSRAGLDRPGAFHHLSVSRALPRCSDYGIPYAANFLADSRSQHLQPDRRAGLSAQDADPDRGLPDAAAMLCRDRPLHHLHSRRRVAATAA